MKLNFYFITFCLVLIQGCYKTNDSKDSDLDGGGIDALTECDTEWGITNEAFDLCWQRLSQDGPSEWQDAMNYCAALTLGGHDDWYLPSREDLLEIFEGCESDVLSGDRGYCSTCEQSSTCNALFGPDDAMYYSSSAVDGFGVWIVDFRDGRVWLGWPNIELARYRCVRIVE